MGLGNMFIAGSIAFLAVAIWFSSNDFRPKEYYVAPAPKLVGPLAPNNVKNVEYLLKGELMGPESIVVEKGVIYTCELNGNCVKIVNGKIQKTVAMTSHKDCTGTRESIAYCGRPLGIRRYNSNKFVVIDAVLGLFFVDFEKGTKELILSSQIHLEGKRFGFPDDFDFADNDTIIFSDASTKYGYTSVQLSFLEHPSDGRIVSYKMSTGELRVLVDGINFPNGVQIHPDKQSVIFTESSMARVHRYYFAGPKKGRHELFVESLPGWPDNVRLSSSGKSFYVALYAFRDNGNNFFEKTAQWPIVRKLLGEVARMGCETLVWRIYEGTWLTDYGMFVEVDLNGKFIKSYHDPTGEFLKHVSQVNDEGDYLYLASYSKDYIGRISKN